jgi:hypothetical protein
LPEQQLQEQGDILIVVWEEIKSPKIGWYSLDWKRFLIEQGRMISRKKGRSGMGGISCPLYTPRGRVLRSLPIYLHANGPSPEQVIGPSACMVWGLPTGLGFFLESREYAARCGEAVER